jgi:hypothetical protein
MMRYIMAAKQNGTTDVFWVSDGGPDSSGTGPNAPGGTLTDIRVVRTEVPSSSGIVTMEQLRLSPIGVAPVGGVADGSIYFDTGSDCLRYGRKSTITRVSLSYNIFYNQDGPTNVTSGTFVDALTIGPTNIPSGYDSQYFGIYQASVTTDSAPTSLEIQWRVNGVGDAFTCRNYTLNDTGEVTHISCTGKFSLNGGQTAEPEIRRTAGTGTLTLTDSFYCFFALLPEA